MWRGQFISGKTKDNHLICARHLLSKFKGQQSIMYCFFLSEKNFAHNKMVNRRNERWLDIDRKNVSALMHTVLETDGSWSHEY